MSIGAFGFRVFTITALAGCTSTSLYLICATGFKQNSYDFFGANHEWIRINTNQRKRADHGIEIRSFLLLVSIRVHSWLNLLLRRGKTDLDRRLWFLRIHDYGLGRLHFDELV